MTRVWFSQVADQADRKSPPPRLTRFVWTRKGTGLAEGWVYLGLLFPDALHAQLVHAYVNWVRCQEIELEMSEGDVLQRVLTGSRIERAVVVFSVVVVVPFQRVCDRCYRDDKEHPFLESIH